MPLQYQHGIIHEHIHTRTHAGLFDISHMGQIVISGSAVAKQLSQLMPSDVTRLPEQSKLKVAEKIIEKIISDPKWEQIKNYKP